MYVTDLSSAATRELDGLVSHILLEEGDAPGGELSIPGWTSRQAASSHRTATRRSRST